MNRELDRVYFGVERDGKGQNVCFTDLTEEEIETVVGERSAEWWKSLALILKGVINDIDNAPSVFSCNACKNMGNEQECVDCHDYSNYVHYDERPKGEWYEYINKGVLKARHGDYVLYKVDYLLDNLAREVNIMEGARQMKGGVE